MTTGLIAIVRGITPPEAPAIGRALYESGFRAIEVPLNSPDPYASIAALRRELPGECRVGAGTVLTAQQVGEAQDAGAELIVSPNTYAEVIEETVRRGLASYPGAATPSEAFDALRAGATAVKIFPSDTVGISGMKAWRSVLPADTELLPVGGVDAGNLAQWIAAGADGAGIGGSLYRAGQDPALVRHKAEDLVRIWTGQVR